MIPKVAHNSLIEFRMVALPISIVPDVAVINA